MPKTTTTNRRTPDTKDERRESVSEWKDSFSDLEETISAAKVVVAEATHG